MIGSFQCNTLYNQCVSVEQDWCSTDQNSCLENCSEEFEFGEIDDEELTECNGFCESDFATCMADIVAWCQTNREECLGECPSTPATTESTQQVTSPVGNTPGTDLPAGEEGAIQKMCLFYPSPSGHGRVDPILDNNGSSGHVHTVSSTWHDLCRVRVKMFYLISLPCCLSFSVLWASEFPPRDD